MKFKKGNIPWNKGKTGLQHHTEEFKQKQRERMIGRTFGGFKKGNTPWNKGLPKEQQPWFGRHHSEKSKQKNRSAHLGKKASKETREKQSAALRGRVFSDEHRKNLSLALIGNQRMKGKTISEEHKRKISSANKGQPRSVEYRKKISDTIKRRGISKLENNPNWRGGISFEEYSMDFNDELKNKIRERDHFICMSCGISESEEVRALNVHHIDYNKKNNVSTNLISLCGSCHGKSHFNRRYWTELLSLKMAEIEWT